MGTEKDRKRRRKQRRQAKLRKLKAKLSQTKDLEERQRITDKIMNISVYHPNDIQEKS